MRANGQTVWVASPEQEGSNPGEHVRRDRARLAHSKGVYPGVYPYITTPRKMACRSGQKRELDSYNGIVEVGGSIPPGSTKNASKVKGLGPAVSSLFLCVAGGVAPG
jgi:hypothetical protein